MEPESIERSLRQHSFVSELAESHIAFLAGCTKNMRFGPGEFLFKEGSAASHMFLLRKGKVALESHVPGRGAVQVITVSDGGILGWSTLFPPHYWKFDGRAIDATLVFAIDGECLRGKLAADHDFGYEFMRRVLYEVHRRLERARLQQLDVYKAEVR